MKPPFFASLALRCIDRALATQRSAASISGPGPAERQECFGPNHFDSDTNALRQVVAALDVLEKQWNDAQAWVKARERGYFTPDEDDRARQILLSYRNYRSSIYKIIGRYLSYAEVREERTQLQGFMIGFAAALALYAKSLKLIATYQNEPLVRKKLNEPDAKFDLESGFFDGIFGSYTSLKNYTRLARANIFWRQNCRRAQSLGLLDSPDGKWLAEEIRHQRKAVKRRILKLLGQRVRYDLDVLVTTGMRPLKKACYGFQKLIGRAFAGTRTTLHYEPAINAAVLARLRPLLQPGDVLLVRAEQKLTSAILPGFWAHSAIYLGGRKELAEFGIHTHPAVEKCWPEVLVDGGKNGQVIEAISPRVLINGLEKSLHADHVLVLRPNVSKGELAEALIEAFAHVGKAYDFQFDFNVTSRIVCTELIYRCYHKKGNIRFPLTRRLGRFTLSGMDIANSALNAASQDPRSNSFQPVALVLKRSGRGAEFFSGNEMMQHLRAIQQGWRPGDSKSISQNSHKLAHVHA